MHHSLSTPPSPATKKVMLLLAVLMTLVALALIPQANQVVSNAGDIRVLLITSQVINNALIAYLILLHCYGNRQYSLGLLAAAFGFSALLSGYRLLYMPGILSGDHSVAIGSHLSLWLWISRMGGFAVLIVLAMLLVRTERYDHASARHQYAPLLLAIVLPCVLAVLAIAILPHRVPDLGQLVSVNGNYSALHNSGVITVLIGCWLAALGSVLLVTRLRSLFHCWLALSCYSYVLYLLLISSSDHRLTIGWYASRFFEQLAAAIMLASLLFEVFKLQKQLQTAYRQSYETSIRDSLTGLYNRRHLDHTLQDACLRAAQHNRPLSILMTDIDHFKTYNDSYGHISGDTCLQQVASCIAQQLRERDMLARYGGEEFTVILENCDLQQALDIAERIRGAVAALGIPAAPGLRAANVTLSIGVYCYTEPSPAPPRQLTERADAALYLAKEHGRNQVCAFQD